MATGSDWLGKFKSRAKSVQETAKNRIEKLSETLDKKIKEAQEDLDKQRSVEASTSPTLKVLRWQPSADNPDGAIIAEVKAPPAPPIQRSAVQLPSVPPTPETQQASTSTLLAPVDEPIVIPRKRRLNKKTEHKSGILEESGSNEELVQKHSDKLSEQIPTVDESVENTAVIATPGKEQSISMQGENKIDVEKQDIKPSKTELNQETISLDIPVDNPPISHLSSKDTPIEIPPDEQTSSMITELLPTNNSAPEDTPTETPLVEEPTSTRNENLPTEHSGQVDISSDEQPASTIIENSGLDESPKEISYDEEPVSTFTNNLPLQHSTPDNVLVDKSSDEQPTSMNIDNSSTEHSAPEDIPIETLRDAEPTLTETDDVPTEHYDRDEQPISTDIDDIPIDNSSQQNSLIDKSDDEQLTSTANDDLPIENSGSEDIPGEITPDEQPVSTDIDDLPVESSSQENISAYKADDEQLTATNTDDLPIENSGSEDSSIEISGDEQPTLKSIDNVSNEPSDSEDIPINQPSDEQLVVTTTNDSINADSHSENIIIDELVTSTNIEDSSSVVHYNPENIENKISEDEPTISTIEHLDLDNVPQNVSDDEIPTLADITDTAIEHYNSENTTVEILHSKPSTLPDIVDTPVDDYNPDNISQDISNDELLSSTKSENLPNEHPTSEDAKTEISDDEQTTFSNNDNSSQVQLGSENISQDTRNDESPVEQSLSESTQTEKLNEELPVDSYDPDHMAEDVPTDEFVVSTNSDHSTTDENLSQTNTTLENISINISDDELPPTAEIVDSSNIKPDSENILMSIPDDELPTLPDIDHATITESDSTNILMSIPDNELPIIEDIAQSPTINSVPANIQTESNEDDSLDVRTDSNSILMNIPDDELPTIEDITDLPIVSSNTENILLNVPDDALPTIENIHSEPKSSPIETKDKKSPSTSSDIPINTSVEEQKILPNELEDSFEDLKTTNIPVDPMPEKPTQEPANLTALRKMITKFEDDDDDDDDDDDFLAPKKEVKISPKTVSIAPEKPNPPTNLKTSLSLSLTSLSDDISDDVFNDSPAPVKPSNDESSIEETYEIVPTMSVETKPVEKKRLSIINSHSIPPGTKIQHINCSSTYIYLCTTNRKIFYAKLNPDDFDSALNWQQHTDLAELLAVSDSNRTVWRLHDKILYTANDPIKYPPIGSQWNKVKLDDNQPLLSMSINDQCGWLIKEDGTLWLLRTDDSTGQATNIPCPFNLSTVFCFSEKVGVMTGDGEILIRAGCTQDTPEGGGWIFIEHNFGALDDFVLLTKSDIIAVMDKKHHLWAREYSSEKEFYQVLCDDEVFTSNERYLVTVNSKLLCLTDCTKQLHLLSDSLTAVQWNVIEKSTRLQRLVGAFPNEDYVWALTTDRRISSSKGQVLEKPRQAQFLTHATFVPTNSSQNTVLWCLDESCGIYVRTDLQDETEWEQANQVQFEWNRRLINIVCSNVGVWAVDDEGCVHFRHGHISANQKISSYEQTVLPPAWIAVPGNAQRNRSFTQVYCGPADWMVYATDNRQNVYTREGINEENRIGTSWKVIEDCSALELAISEHTLWLLTSCGEIQCRENISLKNPIGTRSTTLSGFFLSLTVSMDDSQVWALDSKRNLLKLDRLTVLFEK